MCGLVGAVINRATFSDIELIKSLMRESSVRGLHATGISWLSEYELKTRIEPVPFDKFSPEFDWRSIVDENTSSICMVGHCRYSTSDLEYNQPIADKQVSIVHNGVITQESYDKWHQLYGIQSDGNKNDSSLVWNLEKALVNGAKKHPLEHFPNSSMAVCRINSNGGLTFYRNGKRPLHYYHDDRMTLVASTSDIFKRSSLFVSNVVDPGVLYKTRIEMQYSEFVQLSQRQLVRGIEDLQDDEVRENF